MLNYLDTQDTIIALATPAGVGAIAVIRLSGANAIEICSKFFRKKDLNKQKSHTVHLGYLHNEQGQTIDQVLATIFCAPHSYTKENVVEISCHGSRYIQQQIIELFLRNGARLAKQGEFTLRAFLHGQLDLTQAEAVADLIAADSQVSHDLALRQMRGGFADQIKELREKLIHFASLIELELDFGEEDVEFANRKDLQALVQKIQSSLHQLLDSFHLGNVLKNGVATVIAGRPNAGKSTLLNALLNEERAIVSEIAGTTRDTIEENLVIQGITFRLIDTAGLREATDQIEAIGVQKTYAEIAKSTILVYVYDAILLTQNDVAADLAHLQKEGLAIVVVANKIDVIYGTADRMLFDKLQAVPKHHLKISAKQKQDLDLLRQTLHDLVIQRRIAPDATIVTNSRHYEALHNASDSLEKVLNGLQSNITGDFLAMDIRHALRYLGEITGQVDVEDLLDNIFSKFCIGK